VEILIVFSAAAERDLDRLDPQVARRILRAIQRFAEAGGGDVRRLTAAEGVFRLRVGDWRVRFQDRREMRPTEPPASGMVQVRRIGIVRVLHRSVAYDDL
jgi:mRNA-degrading endonuclease RelE of RelBE toxin-antitoxin system